MEITPYFKFCLKKLHEHFKVQNVNILLSIFPSCHYFGLIV